MFIELNIMRKNSYKKFRLASLAYSFIINYVTSVVQYIPHTTFFINNTEGAKSIEIADISKTLNGVLKMRPKNCTFKLGIKKLDHEENLYGPLPPGHIIKWFALYRISSKNATKI